MKTVTEICKEADAAKNSSKKLEDLWNLVKWNRKSYQQHEIEFMAEHIAGYVEKIEDEEEKERILKKLQE